MSTLEGHKAIERLRSCDAPVCRAKVLPLLYQMSFLISQNDDLNSLLSILLQILERHMRVVRGMINLYHRKTGKIFVHKSLGLSEEEIARGIYSLGEGITGKVVESGQTIVVARIKDEPTFLNRTGSATRDEVQDLSFICVPIMRGKKVLGTLSAERLYDTPGCLQQDVELLTIAASMIAQEVDIYLLENEDKLQLEAENSRLRQALQQRFQPQNLLGSSPAMRNVYAMIERLAKVNVNVLILGESGVGKELVASAIHYYSHRNKGPFVAFNCAALPETLVDSELFGHEKGAFTGANEQRKGRFEEANGGTIFLDEVGELSLPLQAKLLRVLQERSFERLGGNKTLKVDLRILAATNKDLQKMVSEGTFREDLYYRLAVFPLLLPPLRERGADIITLADHFVVKFAQETGKTIRGITTGAQRLLLRYGWPGNVRELENVLQRAVILSDSDYIHTNHLPPSLNAPSEDRFEVGNKLEAKVEAVEYQMLLEALRKTKGNVTEAAKLLGLTKRVASLRMQKYNLNYKDFRKHSEASTV